MHHINTAVMHKHALQINPRSAATLHRNAVHGPLVWPRWTRHDGAVRCNTVQCSAV